MSTHKRVTEQATIPRLSSRYWQHLLASEGERLDRFGINAALLTIQTRSSDEREILRLYRLLEINARNTDQLHRVDERHFALLLTPIEDLTSTVRRANDLHDQANRHNLDGSIGFALRRPQESLLDTWARADAELDRLHFRNSPDPLSNL